MAVVAPTGRFALVEGSLPATPLAERNSRDTAHDMVDAMTGLDSRHWLHVTQVAFLDLEGGEKAILFSAVVPEEVTLGLGAVWSDLSDAGDDAYSLAMLSIAYRGPHVRD